MATQPLGPLTTLFTPPPSCIQTITSGLGSNWAEASSLFIGNFGGNYRSAASRCYPGTTARIDFNKQYYWSPAYSEYCPSGYRTACQYAGGGFIGSTASICCPTSYSCRGGDHLCFSTASDTVISVFVATDQTGVATALSTITLEGLHTIWNDGIPVVWNMDTDSLLFSSLSSRDAQARSTASSLQPSSTNGSSETPSIAPSGSSLSTGAKVGIAVGVGIGCLVVIGALLLFCRSRRGRKQNNDSVGPRQYSHDTKASQGFQHGTEALAYRQNPSELRDRSTVPGVELPA